jgi:aromatic ring-opening dioxygenase catalytic subunit (LigB family)
MLTSHALLVPSVPTLLIDAQRGDTTPMIEAFMVQAERLSAEVPAAIVVVTARWVSAGPFQVDDSRRHASLIDLPEFGVEPRYDCAGEPHIARAILDEARRAQLRAAAARRGADTGVTVPMHFLGGGRRPPVVPVSLAAASREAHRAWGACLRRALAARPEKIAFVVSGALTFNQHEFNLRRQTPEANRLEEGVITALQAGDWDRLATLGRKLPERVHPEAGLRHLEVLRGFLCGDVPGRLCAYETLPGIGAAMVEFPIEAAVEAEPEAHP